MDYAKTMDGLQKMQSSNALNLEQNETVTDAMNLLNFYEELIDTAGAREKSLRNSLSLVLGQGVFGAEPGDPWPDMQDLVNRTVRMLQGGHRVNAGTRDLYEMIDIMTSKSLELTFYKHAPDVDGNTELELVVCDPLQEGEVVTGLPDDVCDAVTLAKQLEYADSTYDLLHR